MTLKPRWPTSVLPLSVARQQGHMLICCINKLLQIYLSKARVFTLANNTHLNINSGCEQNYKEVFTNILVMCIILVVDK